MGPKAPNATEKGAQETLSYETNSLWRAKPLTPSQVAVHDIRLEAWRKERGPILEMVERSSSSLIPPRAAITPTDGHVRASEAAQNPIERESFMNLENEYGWIRHLR